MFESLKASQPNELKHWMLILLLEGLEKKTQDLCEDLFCLIKDILTKTVFNSLMRPLYVFIYFLKEK